MSGIYQIDRNSNLVPLLSLRPLSRSPKVSSDFYSWVEHHGVISVMPEGSSNPNKMRFCEGWALQRNGDIGRAWTGKMTLTLEPNSSVSPGFFPDLPDSLR